MAFGGPAPGFEVVASVNDHNYLWYFFLTYKYKYLHDTIMLIRLGHVKPVRLLITLYIENNNNHLIVLTTKYAVTFLRTNFCFLRNFFHVFLTSSSLLEDV